MREKIQSGVKENSCGGGERNSAALEVGEWLRGRPNFRLVETRLTKFRDWDEGMGGTAGEDRKLGWTAVRSRLGPVRDDTGR